MDSVNVQDGVEAIKFVFEFTDPVGLSSLASIFEVGIGVNLAFTLYEGFKNFLSVLSKKLAKIAILNRIEQRLLPLLESSVSQSTASRIAAKLAQALIWATNAWQISLSSERVYVTLKTLSVLITLAFMAALVLAPYEVGESISYQRAIVAGLLALFPFTASAFVLIIGGVTGLLIILMYAIYQLFFWALLSHLDQLAKREI